LHHNFLDHYSDRDSLVHRLDPRTKLIATLLFVVAVALTAPGSWWAFASYGVIMAVCLLASRVPARHVFKRALVVMPFVAVIAAFIPFFKEGQVVAGFTVGIWRLTVTDSGLEVLWAVLTRAGLSILSLILLTSTTRMTVLLRGMEQLRLPRVMVMILSFMYRYIFVLADEVMRMKRARDSRNFGGRRLWQLRTIGNMIGILFIRSYERGERIYSAMLSRGFDGHSRTLHTLRFRRADALFGAGFGTAVILTGVTLPL